MITIRSVFALILLWTITARSEDPRPDLVSPSQKIRDQAAEIARANFKEPSALEWTKIMGEIRVKDAKEKILEMLKGIPIVTERGETVGDTYLETYRLDDYWGFECVYKIPEDTLVKRSLREHPRHVWVEPPPKFTGVWTTYFVNGQKCQEVHFVDGKALGKITMFHPSGAKALEMIQGPNGPEGEGTGYFPNGKIESHKFHKAGTPVGTWIWYLENGKERFKQEFLEK